MKQGKRTLLVVVIVLINFTSIAQNVAINTTGAIPNASAMLDISATNRGLLIPRVALSQTSLATPITTPATSLLVYNTASINDVSPGYYYWNGSQWVRFFTGSQSDDWTLLGNAGTNPSTNFLGTTDAQDMVIRTNNAEKMRVESGGNVGIGTNNPSYKLHLYGTSNNAADVYSQTDAARVVKHWFVNASRRWSIGQIGSTQTPNYSFQITDETAGSPRMSITTAGNVGIGTTSPSAKLHVDQTSTTANAALIETMASSSTYYGLNVITAGTTTRLYVRADGNVGVGTTAPTAQLHTTGSVRFQGAGTPAVGRVLTSDANGNATWQDPSGSGSGDDWALLGNAGTNPTTNFLGTTDNQELSIRTNNTEKIRLTTKGQIETKNTGHSIFIGEYAGESDDLTTNYNIALGYYSQYASTSGTHNNSMGYYSMRYSGTSNDYNVAIGQNAMRGTTTYSNTDNNVAIGSSSLYSINGGDYNIAMGVNSLYDNTTGSNNIALGNGALTENTTGNYNIAHGAGALAYNTTGSDNIAMGHYAANRNQSTDNIAIGEDALRNATTTCDYNIAIGHFSMRKGTDYTGTSYNVSIGYESMYNIGGGDNNVSIGRLSMRTNTTGYENVSIGYEAMYDNTSGYNNIAIGERALYNNTTGNNNVAIGYWACQGDANGVYNTGVGRYALYQNQGNYNSAFGYAAGAGAGSPTYTYCSFLGYDSDATGSYTNAMALGYSASVTTSNKVRIGNTSITRIEGQVTWSSASDGRVKENITENVVGIDFIMKLRPITYNFNKDKQDQIIGRTDSSEYAEKYDIEKIKFSGFIAQEVEQAALEVGYDFSGVKKPAHQNDLYGLSYSEFVVPLVKATQEQQKDIEALKEENEALRKEIEELYSGPKN
jgi:trimeric autotransporter adhesin